MKKTLILALFLNSNLLLANVAPSLLGTYQDIKKFLKELQTQYPTQVELFDLGLSNQGEMIQGVKIGHGKTHNLLVSTHHGNEYGSTEVAAGFAKSVAEDPILGQTLYVIPVLNISGFNKRERREYIENQTYDPNRDYPGPCGTDGPFKLKSTYALSKLIDQENIITSATLHTFYPAVVYPWGISTHDLSTPYEDLFKMLVQAATQETQYATGNSTDVIYPADGTYEDYAYWKHGIWSILFELGTTHYPSSTQVAEMVQKNVPGLRRMMIQAPLARAEKHTFTGKCDVSLQSKDRHDE